MFSRILLVTCVVLFASLAFGQPYDVKPSTTQIWTVSCYVIGTSRPIANCPLTISTSAINNTGGHYHNTNRPKSQLSTSISGPWSNNSLTNVYTGPNGSTTIYSKASSIGQREQLVVCPQRPEGICTTASVNVRYNDIYYVEEKSEWIHVGGRSEHGGNDYSHWMTLGAAYGIYYAAQQYLQMNPSQGKIAVNDMALQFGRGFRYPFQLGTTS